MKTRTLIKNQDGGAVVEFAIILPLFIFLLFGIIEGSLLLYNKQVITNACREGVRAGLVMRDPRVTDTEIKDTVKNYARSFLVTFGSDTLEDDRIDISPDYSTRETNSFGTDLTVNVRYKYDFLVLFNPITFSRFPPINLSARTVMKME